MEIRQGTAGQGGAWRSVVRQGKAWRCGARRGEARFLFYKGDQMKLKTLNGGEWDEKDVNQMSKDNVMLILLWNILLELKKKNKTT